MALLQANQTDFRHSLITATSCWLAAVFVFWLHCDNPWWAVISAWVLSSSDFQASTLKAIMRVAGTFAGYLVGLLCSLLTEGNPFAQAIALFIIGATGMYMRYRSRFSYAWIIGSVTAFILLVLDVAEPGSAYDTGLYRLYEIIAGVMAVSLCQHLLGPILGLPVGVAGDSPPVASVTRSVNEGRVRTMALIGGLVPVVTLLIWSQLNLPSLVQIIITAFVTLDLDAAAARFRVTQRMLGCLLGGGIGLLVVNLTVSSLFIWSVILFGGILALSRLHLSKSLWAYTGTQGGVAFILAMVAGDHPPEGIGPVVGRIAGMISGVVIVAAVCFVMRLWQRGSEAAAC